VTWETASVPTIWGVTPRQSIERECELLGVPHVVSNCIALLKKQPGDDAFLFVIGGPAARTVLDGREGGPGGYWPRAWALRALRYAWDGAATSSVLRATGDESWRVREAACRVIESHQLDEGLETLAALEHDPVERVRTAALRARRRLTETGSS
jgi:hypothetical protein